jgi:DNA-binding transcriptional ArsR family regulator
VALIVDTISDRSRSAFPACVRRAALGHLRARDVATLSPFRHGSFPSEPTVALPGGSLDDELEAIVRTDPDALARSFDVATANGRPTGPWRHLQRAPERWLRSYATALRRAWVALEPHWTQAATLMDREVERVSVALARGAARELVPPLLPGTPVVADRWWLPSHTGASGDLRAARTIQLRPLLAPPTAGRWSDDNADVLVRVDYPLPNVWQAFDGEHPPPASLEALLGVQRAKLLLALDRPLTAGRLAALLHVVPSAATHHLRALEAAGLVARTRCGREVVVRRTARGSTLLGAYERGL